MFRKINYLILFLVAISAPARLIAEPGVADPPIQGELFQIVPQLDQVAAMVLDKFDPKTHAFIFVGRSPTALRDYMIMVGKNKFQSYQVPVSNLSKVDLTSDAVVEQSDALFKEWLPPLADLNGKKIVVIDFTESEANSLRQFKQMLVNYGTRNRLALPELSTVALRWHKSLAPVERGKIEGVDLILDLDKSAEYGEMMKYSRFREVAPVPFYDILRARTVPTRERKLTFKRMVYLNEIKKVINEYDGSLTKTRKAFGLPPSNKPEWEAPTCVISFASFIVTTAAVTTIGRLPSVRDAQTASRGGLPRDLTVNAVLPEADHPHLGGEKQREVKPLTYVPTQP